MRVTRSAAVLQERPGMLDSRLFFLSAVLLFIGLTIYAYVGVIARDQYFSDNGFFAREPSALAITAGIVIALIPTLWLRRHVERASDFAVLYLYLFVFVPTCVMMPFVSRMALQEQLLASVGLLTAFGAVEFRRKLKLFATPSLDPARGLQFRAVLWVLVAVGVTVLLLTESVSLDNFGSLEVYEQRADFLHDSSLSRAVVGYVSNWIAGGIAPVLLVYGLYTRRYLMVGFGATSALLAFAATSFRSHLFVPLLLAGIYLMLRRFGVRRGALTLLVFALSISIIPILYDTIFSDLPVVTWTVQFRLIGNNGFLSAHYLEFFSAMPKGYFADTFGRFIFEPAYNVPISQVVGESFSSLRDNHANANLWADGYGNLDWFGVFFATIELVFFFWIFDSLARNKSLYISAPLILSASFVLANTSVHSMLTSNGGILLLLFIFALPTVASSARTPRAVRSGPTRTTFL